MANTITYSQLFERVMQERLVRPQNWKEMCDVVMTNERIVSSSYIDTTGSWAAVGTLTRGTAFNPTDVSETNQTLTVSTGRHVTTYFDFADLAQSPWTTEREIFSRSGERLGEFIETDVLAQHASWRNIGLVAGTWTDNDATAGATSASNADDLIRTLRRVIREQNGHEKLQSNGLGIVWSPASFEFIEAFAQANGFESADVALTKGLAPQVHYLGATHYVSNDNATDHVFAGVRKLQRLGILKGTFGRMHKFPGIAGSTGGIQSGIAFHSRVDIGHLTPNTYSTILFDVNDTNS